MGRWTSDWRSQETLDTALAELGDKAIAVVGDNSDPGTSQRLVDAAVQTWGRLDGALISVGGPSPGTVMDTPDEAWTSSFESVFLGGLRVASAVASAIEGPGSIAFVLDRLCPGRWAATVSRRSSQSQQRSCSVRRCRS